MEKRVKGRINKRFFPRRFGPRHFAFSHQSPTPNTNTIPMSWLIRRIVSSVLLLPLNILIVLGVGFCSYDEPLVWGRR